MEKTLYRALFALLFICAAAYYGLFWRGVPAETAFQDSTIPAAFENRVFHWRYDIGWDFRVHMTSEGMHWEGFAGDFEGRKHTVYPHYSQVTKDIHFITWRIPGIGVDSIVLDLENKKVFGHIKANAKFYAIEGEVYCDSIEDACEPPAR